MILRMIFILVGVKSHFRTRWRVCNAMPAATEIESMPMSIEPGDLNTSRLAAQTLPVFASVRGAAINAIFMRHFQSMARPVCCLSTGAQVLRGIHSLPYEVFENEDHASRSSR